MNFGAAIRTARKALRLTQQELATRSGVSRQAVNLLENGGGRIATFLAVAEHARVKVLHLPSGAELNARAATARKQRGWSQAETGRRANLAVNTVRALEEGRGSLRALATLLKTLAPRAEVVAEQTEAKRPRSFPTILATPNRSRDPSDYYATPAPIVRLLLDHEEFTREGTILEPAVGRARVVERVLKERGYENIQCIDIGGEGPERRDFFEVDARYHTLISNPPFRQHREFILHAKRVATHKIAFLLPLNHLTGAARHSGIWSDADFPLARIYILNRGVDFSASDPFADRFETSQMYVAWYIFERGHKGDPLMRWIDNHRMVARSGRAVLP